MHDDELLAAFADPGWDAAGFGHREHLRVAFLFLRKHEDFGLGALEFRAALKRFTEVHAAPEKFHETLTWAWLALIREAMDGFVDATSEAFLARCPQLLDSRHGGLSQVYDLAAIAGDERARRMFVLPRRA